MNRATRTRLRRRIAAVRAKGPHEPWHIATFVDAVLESPAPGVLVECGTYQGVSAAKWSHLAAALGRELWLFDSFQGLPEHAEEHTVSIEGRDIRPIFRPGRFAASLDEVKHTIRRWGVPDVVRYVPGWLSDTLPAFDRPVAGAYLDVDLAASTRTCLDNLWPLVSPGGCVVSQDGNFPLVIGAVQQWAERADPQPSSISGLGTSKMIVIRK